MILNGVVISVVNLTLIRYCDLCIILYFDLACRLVCVAYCESRDRYLVLDYHIRDIVGYKIISQLFDISKLWYYDKSDKKKVYRDDAIILCYKF